MTQELELSDYREGVNVTTATDAAPEKERRLLRIGILILGLMCIIQATLNVSLRLTSKSKDDRDQVPFNSSVLAGLCQDEQQNSTQFAFCCGNVLRQLLGKYRALETERDRLQAKIGQLHKVNIRQDEEFSGSGSFEGSYSPYLSKS